MQGGSGTAASTSFSRRTDVGVWVQVVAQALLAALQRPLYLDGVLLHFFMVVGKKGR